MRSRLNERKAMVEMLARRGIADGDVLAAMAAVAREAFVPAPLADSAYDDGPLPIGNGQTISQPYIVALIIEALQLNTNAIARVLEVGAGSGYAAAVLGAMPAEVIALERVAGLAKIARRNLRRAGMDNVKVVVGDGSQGWPEGAPYDAIMVSAGAPFVPEPLRQQLAIGGRLVLPIGGTRGEQMLTRVTRIGLRTFSAEDLVPVRFVPLIGQQGWSALD